MSKTFVLAHGCHLDVENWEEVIWGDPMNGVYGRIPTALRACEGREDVVLQIGAGGSTSDGYTEGELTFDYLRMHLEEVQYLAHPSSMPFETYVEHIVLLETEAVNTSEEVAAAFAYCLEKGIAEIILVSSPEHAVRCFRDALQLRDSNDLFRSIQVSAVASDVSMEGTSAAKVVVIEPSHRKDRPQTKMADHGQRLVALMQSKQAGNFCFELDAFLTEQEKKL